MLNSVTRIAKNKNGGEYAPVFLETPYFERGDTSTKEIPAIDFGDFLWYNYFVEGAQ